MDSVTGSFILYISYYTLENCVHLGQYHLKDALLSFLVRFGAPQKGSTHVQSILPYHQLCYGLKRARSHPRCATGIVVVHMIILPLLDRALASPTRWDEQ